MDVQEFKNRVLSIIKSNASLTAEQKGELNAAIESLVVGTEAKKVKKSTMNL
jgi:hypothetical protein